jgi:hypothetical protein
MHITTDVVSSNPAHGEVLGFMVFNSIFNNISVKLWHSVLLVEQTGVPGENHRTKFANEQ